MTNQTIKQPKDPKWKIILFLIIGLLLFEGITGLKVIEWLILLGILSIPWIIWGGIRRFKSAQNHSKKIGLIFSLIASMFISFVIMVFLIGILTGAFWGY